MRNKKRRRPAKPVKRSRAQMFTAIMEDTRISHGAYRFWHCLYDYWNPKKDDGEVWPGTRTISERIGARQESLPKWADELKAAGWLDFDYDPKRDNGKSKVYVLMDGQGEVLRKSGAVTATEKRSGSGCYGKAERSATKNRGAALRKTVAEVTLSHKREREKSQVARSALKGEQATLGSHEGEAIDKPW